MYEIKKGIPLAVDGRSKGSTPNVLSQRTTLQAKREEVKELVEALSALTAHCAEEYCDDRHPEDRVYSLVTNANAVLGKQEVSK